MRVCADGQRTVCSVHWPCPRLRLKENFLAVRQAVSCNKKNDSKKVKSCFRQCCQDVLPPQSLRSALRRLNPALPDTALEDAFRQVERIHAPELLAGNQAFHALLTEGVKVTVRRDGLDRGEIVWLADFDCPENNEFLAVNQLTVMENDQQKRPDLVLFVNGLPLAEEPGG
jgi:type I restriction enzyme R subunit